jgi:hypothetical protein
MTVKDLLTIYWSQVTLILLAIGFLIKRLLDIKSKKTEINHSLFQQNRLIAVKNYFSIYAKTELMWQQLSIYEILEHKFPAKEIDKMIFPSLNALQEITYELKLYFEEDCQKYFDKLTNGVQSINGRLIQLYSNLNVNVTSMTTTQKVIDYDGFKENVFTGNKVLMNELCMKIKDLYK